MSGPCCDNCVYCLVEPEGWPRSQWRGEAVVPKCANHPRWPGVVHDVPGVACENYQRKPMPPADAGVRLISLSGGGYAWVDAADYEWLIFRRVRLREFPEGMAPRTPDQGP